MSDEMSVPFLLALLSDRIDEMKNMIIKLRKHDAKYREWDGYDSDITMKRLDWLKNNAKTRMATLLKAQGKNPEDYEI